MVNPLASYDKFTEFQKWKLFSYARSNAQTIVMCHILAIYLSPSGLKHHLAQTSGPDQGHRGDLPSPRSPAKLSVSLRIPSRVGIPQHA